MANKWQGFLFFPLNRTLVSLPSKAWLFIKDGISLFQNIFNPRNELEIDSEDFSGRRTPLYLAVKSKQKESVKLLISHGASTKNSCYGKTIEDLIKDTIPDLNLVTIELISITFSIE